MQKILSSKVVWLGVVVAALVGVLFVQMQANRSPAFASTNSATDFLEGVHYKVIDPPIDADIVGHEADAAAINVTEFFWYGCPHCQYFEPLVEEWQSAFTDDLSFEQVPVVWNDLTQLHASIYYLGLDSEDPTGLHHKLFEEVIALRKQRDPNVQLGQLGEVLMAYGVDSGKITENLNSPSIREQVSRANKLMRAAQVSSTPTLMVDYRWAILNDKETGEAGIFNVANHLIELARQARK